MVEKNLGEFLWQSFVEKLLKDSPPATTQEYIKTKYIFMSGLLSGAVTAKELADDCEGLQPAGNFIAQILAHEQIAASYSKIKKEYKDLIKKS